MPLLYKTRKCTGIDCCRDYIPCPSAHYTKTYEKLINIACRHLKYMRLYFSLNGIPTNLITETNTWLKTVPIFKCWLQSCINQTISFHS